MELSREQLQLVIYAIECHDYISDDDAYEMNEEMKALGYPDFSQSVCDLLDELKGMIQ